MNVIVATTNRNIDCDNDITSGLGGDHMAMVLPAMRERMMSLRLERDVDYRSVMLERDELPSAGADARGRMRAADAYFVNGVNAGERSINSLWGSLRGHEEEGVEVDVAYGRKFTVPRRKTLRGAPGAGAAAACCIDFRSLCDDGAHPMSPYDFMELAKQFDLVLLVGVPVMTRKTKDKARRFINFVDEVRRRRGAGRPAGRNARAHRTVDSGLNRRFARRAQMYNSRTALVLNSEVGVDALFRTRNAADVFDSSLLDDEMDASHESQQVEQLQFESEPERQRLRTDLTAFGGRGILTSGGGGARVGAGGGGGAGSVTTATLRKMLSGEDERFAFRRAVSRLKEMRSSAYRETSKWRNVLPHMT